MDQQPKILMAFNKRKKLLQSSLEEFMHFEDEGCVLSSNCQKFTSLLNEFDGDMDEIIRKLEATEIQSFCKFSMFYNMSNECGLPKTSQESAHDPTKRSKDLKLMKDWTKRTKDEARKTM